MFRRSFLGSATLLALCCAYTLPTAAQTWPSKPVKIVVPTGPGSSLDLIARSLSDKLAARWGQPVVVDNKPGAGGSIGADIVAKAAPDRYTLLLSTSSTHSIAPALNPKLPYDAFKDFMPVAHVATAPSVLVVGKDFPAATAKELIALVKKNPGKYNYGSSGISTYPHLSAEMFKWRAGGLFAVHIPYRGTALVITDLMAGQIAFLMDSAVSAQSHIKDGKVRALAVTGSKRTAAMPSVPTFTEIGVPGLEFGNWFGVFLPAGTAPDTVQRLNTEFNAIVRTAEVVDRFDKLGAEAAGGTAEQFAKTVRDEFESWKGVIQRAGIKAE